MERIDIERRTYTPDEIDGFIKLGHELRAQHIRSIFTRTWKFITFKK